MLARPLVLLLVLGIALPVLGGCLAPGATEAAVAAARATPVDATGCIEAVALFPIDTARLQAHLPDGFTATDAQALFGFPVPMGTGAAFVNAYTCEKSAVGGGPVTAGEIAIHVAPPTVEPDPALGEGTFDFYVLTQYASSDALLTLLDESGYAAGRADAAVWVNATAGPVTRGAAHVDAPDGALWRFAFDAPAPDEMTAVVRLWHATPEGLGVFDLHMTERPIRKGGVTACTLPAGSAAADVLGVTACEPGDAFALVFTDQAWTGAYHHLPGARAV